jgi:hypothetical protein
MYKVAEKNGAHYQLGADKYYGEPALIEQLANNPELLDYCVNAVREAHAKRYDAAPAAPVASEPEKPAARKLPIRSAKK